MTQEALKLAIQLRDTASGYWTENEIPIIEKLIELLAQEQEPFGYFKAEPFGWTDCAETDEGAVALYTTPPQRKPLTDDELFKICMAVPKIFDFARAIEAAHGIKENT